MAGNYPPSSDVIRNSRAGTPGEAGAEVRALLPGNPLHTQSKLAVQDTHKDSQSQNRLGCTPHICCGFAQQLLSSLHPHLRPGKYRITRQQSLFIVWRDQHHVLETKHDSSWWALPVLSLLPVLNKKQRALTKCTNIFSVGQLRTKSHFNLTPSKESPFSIKYSCTQLKSASRQFSDLGQWDNMTHI